MPQQSSSVSPIGTPHTLPTDSDSWSHVVAPVAVGTQCVAAVNASSPKPLPPVHCKVEVSSTLHVTASPNATERYVPVSSCTGSV